MPQSAPEDAEIVIVGGGVIGCAIAYHLTRMGQGDVLVLERRQMTHGATWHAAGLVGQLRSSRNKTRLMQQSVELYDRLEAETGQPVDWKKVGSLRLACSEERMHEIRRSATIAKSFGLEFHVLTAAEAADLFPLMSTQGVLGAAFIPGDGHVDPASLTQALAKGARDRGAVIRQGVTVSGLVVERGRVTALETDHGRVRCDLVVNAAGIWGRELGRMAGVRAPVIALEHQYLLTEPIPDMPSNLPTLRDPDHRVYVKPEVRGMAVGGWEANTVAWGEDGIPADFGPELLPDNFERFEGLAEAASMRIPAINEVGVRQLINGPIPWSADGDFFMGRAPELDNYFVCGGFTYGIAAGGGAGKMMAEWIVRGAPGIDLFGLDVRRFGPHHNATYFLYPALHRALRQVLRPAHAEPGERKRPRHPAQPPLRDAEGKRRRLRLQGRMGARQLVRPARHGGRRPAILQEAELARRGRRRMRCAADQRRAHRHELIFQVRAQGSGRTGGPATAVRGQCGEARGQRRLHPNVQPSGRHRDRHHHLSDGRGRLLHSHRQRLRRPRLRLDQAQHSGPCQPPSERRHLVPRGHPPGRPERPQGAGEGQRGRRRQGRLSLCHGPGDARRGGAGPGRAHLVRGRAGLGAAHPHRVHGPRLRGPDRSRAGVHHPGRRLPGHPVPAPGEGLPRLVHRHHRGRQPARGGARRPHRLRDQGRLQSAAAPCSR